MPTPTAPAAESAPPAPRSTASPSKLLADLSSAVRALALADEELEAIEAGGDDAHAGILAMQASTIQTRVSSLILELEMEADAVAAEHLSEVADPMLDAADVLVVRVQPRITRVLTREPQHGGGRPPLVTGDPLVDQHGTVCDQPSPASGLDCRLTHDQRRLLITKLLISIVSAMNHFTQALGVKYADLVGSEKKGDWPVLADLVMDALLGPAGGAIGKYLAEELKGGEKELTALVGGGLKWAKGLAKGAAAGIPPGEKGKEAFLRHMTSTVDAFGAYCIGVLPPNLDDAGLTALYSFWSDQSLHGPDAYAAAIDATLARFDAQVARIGEFETDGGRELVQKAAARIQHRGRERMALVARTGELMTKQIGAWRFERWIDEDVTDLAREATIDRIDENVGPFDVDAGDAPGFVKTPALELGLARWDAAAP